MIYNIKIIRFILNYFSNLKKEKQKIKIMKISKIGITEDKNSREKREIYRTEGKSTQQVAKIAGVMFLLAFILPTLNWALILSGFNVENNVIETTNNILANEIFFRVGVTIELFMAVGLIVLAWALYILLKPVNRNFALLALLIKLAEAGISAVIVLVTFIALNILNSELFLSAFTIEQLKAPLGLTLVLHTAIFSIPMVFLGLDMMIFSYLLYKSKYIPVILAGFGILAFALIFIHAILSIIKPQFSDLAIYQIIFWTPSGIFEIIIGMWLLIKGLNISAHKNLASKTN